MSFAARLEDHCENAGVLAAADIVIEYIKQEVIKPAGRPNADGEKNDLTPTVVVVDAQQSGHDRQQEEQAALQIE